MRTYSYYICKSKLSWHEKLAIKFASLQSKQAFPSIKTALKALVKKTQRNTGLGYFDLRILKSYNGGETLEELDTAEDLILQRWCNELYKDYD